MYQSGTLTAANDIIEIHLDAEGNPQGLSINSGSGRECRGSEVADTGIVKPATRKLNKMKTKVSLNRGDIGPSPYLDQLIKEIEKKSNSRGDEPQSFLGKYVRHEHTAVQCPV